MQVWRQKNTRFFCFLNMSIFFCQDLWIHPKQLRWFSGAHPFGGARTTFTASVGQRNSAFLWEGQGWWLRDKRGCKKIRPVHVYIYIYSRLVVISTLQNPLTPLTCVWIPSHWISFPLVAVNFTQIPKQKCCQITESAQLIAD